MSIPRLILLVVPCIVVSCGISPPTKVTPEPPSQAPANASSGTSDATPPEEPTRDLFEPHFCRLSLAGIRIEAIVYDSRSHELLLADQPGGPGSIWPNSKAAGTAHQGLAAINAGFFSATGAPLGLVVSEAGQAGSINRSSSLGSGFYTQSPTRTPQLIRREHYRGASLAVQSGPFIIESGRTVSGLSDKAATARTFIATDGRSGWILARSGPCSLKQLASALQGSSILGVGVLNALNLDGGRSSEIWVSEQIQGGPAYIRPLWNKPVRNFLILRPHS